MEEWGEWLVDHPWWFAGMMTALAVMAVIILLAGMGDMT